MGDDIGSGSMTGCHLWSLDNILCWLQGNQNKRNPNGCRHPLITQLSLNYSLGQWAIFCSWQDFPVTHVIQETLCRLIFYIFRPIKRSIVCCSLVEMVENALFVVLAHLPTLLVIPSKEHYIQQISIVQRAFQGCRSHHWQGPN